MSKIKDETNNTYTYLTVLKRGPNSSDGRARWICQCKCGNTVTVLGSNLRNGKTKSCGCYQKEQTSKASTINLIGKTIGNFTILDSIQGTKNNERHKWRCRCNLCGNENVEISTSNIYSQYSCGCSISSKGERKIREILDELQIQYIQEKRFNDCRFDNGYLARFDFYLPVYNTIIEYDGKQHSIQGNGNFDNNEKFQTTQEHDNLKTKYCQDKNIKLIRIPFYDYNKLNVDYIKEKIAQ